MPRGTGTALRDTSDDLVAGYDGELRRRRASLDLVQLSMTDTADGHFDHDLAGTALGDGTVDELQRLGPLFE
jgi:hypothetical protein